MVLLKQPFELMIRVGEKKRAEKAEQKKQRRLKIWVKWLVSF
jgi:hypothetical protein